MEKYGKVEDVHDLGHRKFTYPIRSGGLWYREGHYFAVIWNCEQLSSSLNKKLFSEFKSLPQQPLRVFKNNLEAKYSPNEWTILD
jgi:ribosomal protein S6